MALEDRWDAQDILWLRRLTQAVPLAEGRMEIRSSLFAVGWRLCIVLCFFALGAAGVAGELWSEGPEMSRILMFVLLGGISVPAMLTYGARLGRLLRGRPEFVLSGAGIALNGRLLRWGDIRGLVYDCQNLRGYRSARCKVTLVTGQVEWLSLETVSLSPRRVMLLMDFYAVGDGILGDPPKNKPRQ